MILGHKEPPGEDAYWFGKVNGVDKKYARLVAVILPMFDRQHGAVVVLGELYRGFAAPDFTGLGAAVGEYNAIERALLEFDRDLQFREAILEHDDLRPLVWKIPGLSLKILTATAPKYAFTEIGRQKVNRMGEEGHLHLELIEDRMEQGEPEVVAKAIQAAVCWMQEYPSLYRNAKKKEQPEYVRIWRKKDSDMAGEKLLNLPYLEKKFAKLLEPHLHTERLMDQWHREAPAQVEDKRKPKRKEEPNVTTKRKPRNKRRRKRQNIEAPPRGKAAGPSRSNGVIDEKGGTADAGGWLSESEEEVKDEKENA